MFMSTSMYIVREESNSLYVFTYLANKADSDSDSKMALGNYTVNGGGVIFFRKSLCLANTPIANNSPLNNQLSFSYLCKCKNYGNNIYCVG